MSQFGAAFDRGQERYDSRHEIDEDAVDLTRLRRLSREARRVDEYDYNRIKDFLYYQQEG